jgi:hypothetical protein
MWSAVLSPSELAGDARGADGSFRRLAVDGSDPVQTAHCSRSPQDRREKARAVQQRVLDRAPDQTLGRLKAALKRAFRPRGAARSPALVGHGD